MNRLLAAMLAALMLLSLAACGSAPQTAEPSPAPAPPTAYEPSPAPVPEPPADPLEKFLDSMTLAEKVGQLFFQLTASQDEAYLKELLQPYDLRRVDAVVLGCTHYVFLRPVLRRLLPETTLILDGNAGTARQLARVLNERGLLRETGAGSITLETSGNADAVLPQMRRLLTLARSLEPGEASFLPKTL